MRRTISEKEPARPSNRLSTMLAGELTTTARHRRTDAPKLIHLVRGDLDWIVMKALEKDRARRYETANGLAMDLQRHLRSEPVTARPPSNLYRLQKLAQRNKVAFAAVSAVAFVLVLCVIVSTWQAVRATRAEHQQVGLRLEAEQARDRETKLRKEAEIRERGAGARFLLDSGAFEKVDGLLSGLSLSSVEFNVRNAEVFRVLSDWNVVRGRWREAANALDAIFRLGLLDTGASEVASRDLLRFGCLLLEASDIEAYEDLRRNTLTRPEVPNDYFLTFRVAQLGLLRPIGDEMTIRIKRYVSKIQASPARWPEGAQWESFLFALFEYRRGNCTRAVAYCRDVTNGPPNCAACTFAVLAASHQRLNHPVEARAALAQCEATVSPNAMRIRKLDEFWYDWMFAQFLQREAKALIQLPPTATKE